jgi:hypothetical protein
MLEIVLSDRNVGRALALSRWLGLRSRGVWFVARRSPGLWDGCRWLSINLLGDLFNVISGGEPRAIIGTATYFSFYQILGSEITFGQHGEKRCESSSMIVVFSAGARQPRRQLRRCRARFLHEARDSAPFSVTLQGSISLRVCKELDIPWPGRGYWAKKAAGKSVKQPVRPNELSVWKVSDP